MLFRREVLEGIAGAEEITEEDAVRSGFEDRAALLTALSKSTKQGGYHRVMPHRVMPHLGGPDPRSEPAGDADLTGRELADLKAALDAIDARSRRAPWTREVLRLIEERPGLAGDRRPAPSPAHRRVTEQKRPEARRTAESARYR